MDPLLDVETAARLLAISPYTVRMYLRIGKLCPVRIGRRVLPEESELKRFVDEAKISLPRKEAPNGRLER